MTNSSTETVLYFGLNGHRVTILLMLVNVVISLLGFFSLSLNALVLDTLVRRTALEATDLVMCNLAVTDMLTGVLILHTVLYNLVYFQHTTECLVRMGSVFIFISSSVYHLTLLTIDRFVKIVFPFRYQDLVTRRISAILSSVVWLFSVTFGLLPSFGWRDVARPGEPPCSFLGVLPKNYIRLGLAVFFTPVVVICALYSKIFSVVRRHARAIAANDVAGSADSGSMKFTKTVVILIGTYLVSFLPMATIALIYTLGGFPNMSAAEVGDYIVYSSVLTFSNSVVNPVIYAFKVPPVRKRFRHIFRRGETATSHGQSTGPIQTLVSKVD